MESEGLFHGFRSSSVSGSFSLFSSCFSLLLSPDWNVALICIIVCKSVGCLLPSQDVPILFKGDFGSAIVFFAGLLCKPPELPAISLKVHRVCFLSPAPAFCLELCLQEPGFSLLESYVVFI